MIAQLSLATVMALVTVSVHLFGLAILVRLLRTHQRLLAKLKLAPMTVLLGAAVGLVVIHTAEIWLYAGLYLLLGAAANFESALYFSTVTYATIGYGDVLIDSSWRILGAIEGAIGVIMLGWSTAFLVSLLAQLKFLSHDWLGADRSG
jgi:hypothetical protein